MVCEGLSPEEEGVADGRGVDDGCERLCTGSVAKDVEFLTESCLSSVSHRK